MSQRDIELWTLHVIDRFKGGQPIEDSRVELKSEWVDARQAARRIAAHANAARGEPILWIIGLDEGNHTVVGAQATELATWFAQVISHFDELAPELTDIAVPIDGTTVVALRFATDRAPYVIKHQDARLTREVPWREGTLTRSAKRSEILRILATVPQLPEFEVLSASMSVFPPREDKTSPTGRISMELYVHPQQSQPIILPTYGGTLGFRLALPGAALMTCQYWDVSTQHPLSSSDTQIHQAARLSAATIYVRDRDILVKGPGTLYIRGHFEEVLFPVGFQSAAVRVELSLAHASFPRTIIVGADLVSKPSQARPDAGGAEWYFLPRDMPNYIA